MVSKVLFASMIAGAAMLYQVNQETDSSLMRPIKVIRHNSDLESKLTEFKSILGADYDGYKGHLYRVLTYTQHFRNNDETYLPLIAIALVYHDIGLWTDAELAYLEPSIAQGHKDTIVQAYSPEEQRLFDDIIFWHHKITDFHGPHEDIVNAVRKADWIDANMGMISKGMPREHIAKVMLEIPTDGFHQTLGEFVTYRVHGWNIPKAAWRLVTGIIKF
jgi:hypothetical protein